MTKIASESQHTYLCLGVMDLAGKRQNQKLLFSISSIEIDRLC
jgi:hypothetical protein